MVTETQRRAATIVGAAYLLALAPAIFSEFYVSRELVVRADMGATARNILEHPSLYRLGRAGCYGGARGKYSGAPVAVSAGHREQFGGLRRGHCVDRGLFPDTRANQSTAR